ncbi:MAG: hypothetical protein RMJ43_00625, partial [Chloroherpetonaceae bacterium]|nr:hypothetical protein [Chthonomonadaceae bacterium]MDW8206313.1 hypothetical protein [Chloroherpetonaceae bacterium]
RYDPSRPHAERYVRDGPPVPPERAERLTCDCLTLCRALGYEMNTVEFAVKDGVPYAIDFLNPAPDADYYSVGEANFRWFVDAMAELAVAKAKERPRPVRGYRWSRFLQG